MQLQIHEAEAELAHLRIGAAIGARAHHLPEQLFGNRLAGLVMAGEQVERFALPAPVLHDLAGQFDEVPGDGGARQALHFHAAQHVMQQMAEFVEDRFHFAMSQQRGLVADRRREVAANTADVRLERRRLDTGDEAFHPGAIALGFAREPIGVESAEQHPSLSCTS